MRRLPLLVLLVLALGVAPAQAQVSDPFNVLTPTPTPTATSSSPSSADDTSDRTLLFIAAGVLIVFVGIGVFITKDARRNLTAEDRAAVERGDIETHLEDDDRLTGGARGKQKAKARKKGKAQRRARKANRPR